MEFDRSMGRFSLVCLLLGAVVGWSGCSPTQMPLHQPGTDVDFSTGGIGGNGGGGGTDDGADMSVLAVEDGGHAYEFDLASSNTMCVPPQMGKQCVTPIGPSAGCKGAEDCGPSGRGNGLDDNCNGTVDEGCPCQPGSVEKCFQGPPGKRGVGGCTDGSTTCEGLEFGMWGPCKDSISPSGEKCDNLDNDCNGCSDDSLCCTSVLDCPAPGDPRIKPVKPFTDLALKGELFFSQPATSWSWKIEGGPCDKLFLTSTGTPPVQSFTLTGPTMKDATVKFTLSGDYTVTLTVVGADGQTYTCTWVQHVEGPGLRFEMCWDHTDKDDIDLHVHKPGTTTSWFRNGGTDASPVDNPDDCYYKNCKADEYTSGTHPAQPNWSYASSAIDECKGGPDGATWQSGLMACHNPRLDVDNTGGRLGVPENINIDNPADGQVFRTAVHYYRGASENHPIVNIYCGGTLKSTFGQAPNTLTGFNGSVTAGYNKGFLWRVADVKVNVDATGIVTGCDVTALHPPATPNAGYYVTTDDMKY
ncbi:MAG: hypothetical protein JWN44_6094 [Myxococcales bacterium]|nr:hypothetical protein [Myxococcales bacterium]